MVTFKIQMQSGAIVEVAGRRFSHYVGNEQFWFFLHRSVDTQGYDVSDWNSGKRVLHVPPMAIIAALGDEKAAAKGELDKLIARVGAARVRSVLAAG